MCGIFGFCASESSPPPGPDLLRSMGDALRHRGPDDDGFFLDGPVGLGMRRLSIIDLKTGRQPISNEDGSLQIVFNGEIYNYQALMQELLARGHTFSTSADTEVIVHLYEELGKECLHRLRGMFAFALWDGKAQTLFIARDRLGIKPLYYAPTRSGLVFASELKALLRFPGIDREVDPEALCAYLQFGYVPEPLSILRGVSKLPAGHWLERRRDGTVEVTPYWDPAPFFANPISPASEEALLEELRWRLRETVKLHLVSDVPVGAFLSGGLDSSAVVAMMASELGGSVKTFSIGFAENGFSELPYARAVARRFGTDHHELIVEPESVDLLERLAEHFDEPFADPSAIPTYFVSKLARDHLKVVLSGDGGDELFAGYDRYVTDHRRRRWDVIPRTGASRLVRRVSEALPETAPGKYFLFNVTLPRPERYVDAISHFPHRLLPRLLARDIAATLDHDPTGLFAPHLARGGSLGFPDRLQYLDLKTYLPGDILTKVDRMSMAHSVEARVPLLDHALVEFVAGIPSRYKLRNGATKHIFKRAIEGLLPPEVLSRGKQGFGVPLTHWFRDGLHDRLREHLLGADALRHGYFDRGFVAAHFGWYERTGRTAYLDRLWTLLVFELWHRAIIDRHG
ncbi:MAG: asparagine synthase (glutamine-hydrolyzing) [Candidatus Rokuibacteriota bacterium]|nr:MAG: asparagine synthase (glutamine-hydrolyzing) [Candidatus Rokubacteria bacterium]